MTAIEKSDRLQRVESASSSNNSDRLLAGSLRVVAIATRIL